MNTEAEIQFDPYYKWLGIPPAEQPPSHYRLLGLNLLEEDADVISAAADRQMAHVKSYATGRFATHSQDLLNELSRARVTLLNPDRKREYDKQLKRQLETKKAIIAAIDSTTPYEYSSSDRSLQTTDSSTLTPSSVPIIKPRLRKRRKKRKRGDSHLAIMVWLVLGLVMLLWLAFLSGAAVE